MILYLVLDYLAKFCVCKSNGFQVIWLLFSGGLELLSSVLVMTVFSVVLNWTLIIIKIHGIMCDKNKQEHGGDLFVNVYYVKLLFVLNTN